MKAKRVVVALSVAAVVGLAPVAAMARNGTDDPAGHNARDDRVRTTVVDGRGHDDPQRDPHGGHGHHDGLRAATDDRSTNEAAPNDDNGANEAEPGDDNAGAREAERNDHRGGHANEPGDDHSRHGGHESGDDHGGR